MPSYSMINSKMIVCNFTNMEMEVMCSNLLLFMIFPFARVWTNGAIPECYIAMLVFILEVGVYMTFVLCTIS